VAAPSAPLALEDRLESAPEPDSLAPSWLGPANDLQNVKERIRKMSSGCWGRHGRMRCDQQSGKCDAVSC